MGLALVGGIGWFWQTLAPRELPDTAPLDLRGQPINAAPASPPQTATNTVAAARPASTAKGAGARPVNLGSVAAPAAATGRPTAGTTEPASGEVMLDGHLSVGFDRLAGFTFEMPTQPLPTNAGPESLAGRIPPAIEALNGKPVALKGFMLPLKIENGLVAEMLIMRDQSMCCFGVVPKINEWVSVKMVTRGVKPVMDQPVTVFGKLRVGVMVENGYVVAIYALEGESLATALDL